MFERMYYGLRQTTARTQKGSHLTEPSPPPAHKPHVGVSFKHDALTVRASSVHVAAELTTRTRLSPRPFTAAIHRVLSLINGFGEAARHGGDDLLASLI
jgi:hypothetical protein